MVGLAGACKCHDEDYATLKKSKDSPGPPLLP